MSSRTPSNRLRPFRGGWLPILAAAHLALAAAASPAAAYEPGRPSLPRLDEPTWSVGLHMHASLSEGSGSMEWHANLAHQYGLDAIWWTDHDWRVGHVNHTRRFDFETGVVNGFLTVTEPDDAYPGDFRYWETIDFATAARQIAIVDTLAYEGSRSLRIRAWDSIGDPSFRTLWYTQTGSRRQNMYALASRPHFRFALFPELLDVANARFFVDLTLSEHGSSTHRLRYVVGSTDGEPVETQSLPFTPGQWNFYDLDLAADAIQLLTSGGADSVRAEDNSLYVIRMGIDVRNSSDAVVFFDDLQYEPDPTLDGPALLDWSRSAGDYYETIYPGVNHLIGSEISYFRAQPHLNGYAAPFELVDYSGHGYADSLYYAVDQVHAQGGAVSLNHMYGVGIYGDLSETDAEKLARIRWMKKGLIGCRALGVDVLEVGYRWRHGIDLSGHLAVWDALNANAIFLTANGITDSHGSVPFHGWGPQIPGDPHRENNFVTWFHAPAPTEADLLPAMLGGRAYFGDPYEFGWNSEIDLATTDGFPMGRVVLTDRPSHDVVVEIDGLPTGAEVRFLQAEIRENPPVEYLDPVWIRDEILSAAAPGSLFTDTVTVDTSLPTFTRIEIANLSGDPIAFSNPIHFVRDVPAVGIPAVRLGAAIGDARILSAGDLILLDAEFQAWPPQLELTLDEDAPGLGFLGLEVSALGPPGAVLGASTWQYDTGLLTLSGFEGTGSTVTVRWGPVDAPTGPALPRDVSLAPGRPNPFGRGLVTEIALPHPALATLEVLDVRGRRVRILLDERRDAGVHRIAWDGTDPYGRPVAAGVYFLRLRAAGQSLTTKAVKLR